MLHYLLIHKAYYITYFIFWFTGLHPIWVESILFLKIYTCGAGLSDVPGLSIISNPLSPIVFLKLKKPTGSFEKDLRLLEDIVNHVKQ